MKPHFRPRLKAWLKKRISFRLHMSVIMLSTVLLGMVSNFILFNTFQVNHPALRYPLTVLISYVWFLLFIRIYIKNILSPSESNSSLSDFVDLPISEPNLHISRPSTNMTWKGGGGQFSGGGSSGSWDSAAEVGGEAAGSVISDVAGDEGIGLVILIVGAILVAAVMGSGAYLIWHSPEILSECLLQVIMVSGMRKKMKSFSEREWLEHIFKATYLAFLVTIILSMIAGAALKINCPNANSLREARTRCF